MADDKKEKPAKESGPTGIILIGWRIVLAELSGGRSNPIMAAGGTMHANDMLHTAGLISDDAWNAVKGWAQTFSSVDVFKTGTSALKTLVETGVDASTELLKLASLGGAEAEAVG